jgi:DNA-binding NarL/FixJ family response regulator
VIRVLVADDQALVRSGFCLILDAQPDIEVVGQAGDGHQAVRMTRTLRPDVVLMDIRMPGLDGLEATRQICGAGAGAGAGVGSTKVLVLTTFDVDDYVYRALRAGASGFLLKDVRPEQLAEAVRTTAAGEALLAPSITRRLIAELVSRPPAGGVPEELSRLTDRELEVLRHMAQGLSNAEIAEMLVIGEATVKTHVNRILSKLGLRDRVQAVVLAYETGLVRSGGS